MISINLTQGQVTFVDDADADLAKLNWYASLSKNYGKRTFVARRSFAEIGNYRKIHAEYLHRVVLSRVLSRPLAKGEIVDHINGNPLDNRRSNLRLASVAENSRNHGISKRNTSGVRGVSWHKGKRKWAAAITIHLGYFDNLEDAQIARERAESEFWGEFAPTSPDCTKKYDLPSS